VSDDNEKDKNESFKFLITMAKEIRIRMMTTTGMIMMMVSVGTMMMREWVILMKAMT